jgi:hypothetical protein
MVSLARKEFGFVVFFHLIGILGESQIVSKLRKAESAQHSVPHDHWDNNAVNRWVGAARPAGSQAFFVALGFILFRRRIHAPTH